MSIERGQSRGSVSTLTTHEASGEVAVPTEVEHSPLFGVAMLKIAMELKKADGRPLDELIAGVLTRMRLPEQDFRDFLSANGGLLRKIATRKAY